VRLKAYPWVVRQFWDHIRDGMAAAESGVVVGVSVCTGRKWFADAGGVRPKFPDDRPRKWGRLTFEERVKIEVGVRLEKPIREIARWVDRHPTTIMREIERNAFCYGRYRERYRFGAPKKGGRDAKPRYRATGAQARTQQRARRPKPGKLASISDCTMRCRLDSRRNAVPSRSLGGCSWIFPMMRRCGCPQKPSTSRSTCKGAAVCAASYINACAPGGRYANRSAVPVSVADLSPTWSISASAQRRSKIARCPGIGKVI
jgi:Helix-turn-helix domain